MRKHIRLTVDKLLRTFNRKLAHESHFLTQTTDSNAVRELITKLKPVAIQTPLIRLGPDGDGGYLVPDDIKDIEACFSPGVSSISGFESDCANYQMKVFLADKSVEAPAETNPEFSFIKRYVGAFCSKDFITLDAWVSESMASETSDLLLQMDIEGFEYEVILNTSAALQSRFRIIVIEFHHLTELWNSSYFGLISRAFEKLLQTHVCVHMHPNNYAQPYLKDDIEIPPLMEMTFLRKDRVEQSSNVLTFPHPLDFDNTEKPSLPLPKCWYS